MKEYVKPSRVKRDDPVASAVVRLATLSLALTAFGRLVGFGLLQKRGGEGSWPLVAGECPLRTGWLAE